jgi:hypothetical protein
VSNEAVLIFGVLAVIASMLAIEVGIILYWAWTTSFVRSNRNIRPGA